MAQTNTTQQAEAAAERIRELNERVLEFGKKAGLQFLEAYESNMKTFADYGDKFADSAQADGSRPQCARRPTSRAS